MAEQELAPTRSDTLKKDIELSVNDGKVYEHGVAVDDLYEPEAYGAVLATSYFCKTGYPWEYAIQIPAFKRGSGSADEKNALELATLLVRHFGDGQIKVKPNGRVDRDHGYIKVAATRSYLERNAESMKLRVRMNPWKGKGYRQYTRLLDEQGYFQVPFYNIDTEQEWNDRQMGQRKETVLLPYQRQLIVRRRIEFAFDQFFESTGGRGLQQAMKEKRIEQLYPLHTTRSNKQSPFPSRREVLDNYCGWRSSATTTMAIGERSHQMLEFVRNYLGEKIALYFAFLHFFTAWLVPLSAFGIALAVYSYGFEADNVGVPIYSFIVSVWSTLFLEFWHRRNARLAYEWDMLDYEELEKEIASFATPGQQRELGFYEKYGSWVDMTQWVESAKKTHGETIEGYVQQSYRDYGAQCPAFCLCCASRQERMETGSRLWRFTKELLSLSVVFTLLAGVVATTLSLLVLRLIAQRDTTPLFGGAAVGVLQALAVAILDRVFQTVALVLNNWENHRTPTEYEDKLIAKTFFFQFINAYLSLYYIAFVKGGVTNTEANELFGYVDQCRTVGGAVTDSCMSELSSQLTALVLTRLFIGNLFEWAIPKLELRIRIRDRINKIKKNIRKKHKTWDEAKIALYLRKHAIDKNKVDVAEKQGHMPEYTVNPYVSGTFYDYIELVILFGYITLFAPAFPLAPLLAVISNIVENRNDGYKILFNSQKPEYKGARNIGTWFAIFRILSVLAVITNMGIIGFTSSQLESFIETPGRGTKLIIVVAAEHVIFAIQFLIHYFVPDLPTQVRVEIAEQQEIQRVEAAFRAFQDYTEAVSSSDDEADEKKKDVEDGMFDSDDGLLSSDISESDDDEPVVQGLNQSNSTRVLHPESSRNNNNNNNSSNNDGSSSVASAIEVNDDDQQF